VVDSKKTETNRRLHNF